MRIFKSPVLHHQLSDDECNKLVEDFRVYKQQKVLPDTFGRDVPYDHPNTYPAVKNAEVFHIHLAAIQQSWHSRKNSMVEQVTYILFIAKVLYIPTVIC